MSSSDDWQFIVTIAVVIISNVSGALNNREFACLNESQLEQFYDNRYCPYHKAEDLEIKEGL